jgi:hypothetical protein
VADLQIGSSFASAELLSIAAILTHPYTVPEQPICLFNEIETNQ